MDEFVTEAKKLNITLTAKQTELFAALLRELKAWNAHTNLTAIRKDNEIIRKHFLDSLSVLQAIPENTRSIIDIGSGAGFPGLPIAIMRDTLRVTLLESVGKKVSYLEHVITTLNLSNTTALVGRAEEAAHDEKYREQFDVATARAVARLTTLAEYCLPFVKVGGLFIAQKNAGGEEIDEAMQALKILGGTIQNIIPVAIPGLEPRQLIVIEKTSRTPSEYPRHTGIPQKKPLE